MAGYFILHTKWHTLDDLREYQAGAQKALREAGARPLAYDVSTEVVEGESPFPATIIIEFDSVAAAKAWYHSDAYQQVLGLRLASSDGEARFVDSANPAR